MAENDKFTIPGLQQATIEYLAQQLLPLAQVDEAVAAFVATFQKNGKVVTYKDRYGYNQEVPVEKAVAVALGDRIKQASEKRAEEILQTPEIQQMITRIAQEAVLQTMQQMPDMIGQLLARRILAQSDPYGNVVEHQLKWRHESIIGILNETRGRLGLPSVQIG